MVLRRVRSRTANCRSRIEDRKSKPQIAIADRRSKLAAFSKYLLDGARNQSPGGGRINSVATGRKIGEISTTGIARTAVTKTGADGAGAVFSPACAVAQIEQVWRDVAEFSGCEWAACTVPIAHIRTAESKHTALTHPLRFANIFNMPSRYRRSRYVALDDSIVRWSSREIRCPKMMLPACPPEHSLQAGGGGSISERSSYKLLLHKNLSMRSVIDDSTVGSYVCSPAADAA